MKYPNSIEVYNLEFKIDEKLHKIQKRKAHSSKSAVKSKNPEKVAQQIKWLDIKRYVEQLRKPQKQNLKIVRPLLNTTDLLDVINRIMLSQNTIIKLANSTANYRRMQMLCIFFHCSLSIIFNAYNLVVFLLKLANETGNVPLSLSMLLFFYGYHIINSMADILSSVLCYTGVFKSIRKTASKMDELNMYIIDSSINARISQVSAYVFNNLEKFTLFGLYNIDGTLLTSIIAGTTTYIIILIQYSGDGEICKREQFGQLKMNDSRNPA